MAQDRPVAAFDFDGTLTIKDTFLAFLRFDAGPTGTIVGVLRLLPDLVSYLFHRDRGRVKAAAVRVFLKGRSEEALAAAAERFAARAAKGLLRADAVAEWERRSQGGAAVVIVTASPEIVIRPFADRLGADLLLGTRLATDQDGRLTGALFGQNCRGAEKVRRLEEAFGPELRLEAAFGDTSGDREMLARAAHKGFREFTSGPQAP
jgi:phosphatidylglycerophosphatase C